MTPLGLMVEKEKEIYDNFLPYIKLNKMQPWCIMLWFYKNH